MDRLIYEIDLDDYSLPGFCSGTRKYYGTADEVKAFVLSLNNAEGSHLENLVKAIDFNCSNGYILRHTVEYDKGLFISPVTLIAQASFRIKAPEWMHLNIYGYPYYMKADSAIISEMIVKSRKIYVKCARAELKNLRYSIHPTKGKWKKLTDGFWGFPGIIQYDPKGDKTFSSLFFVEKESERKNDPELKIGDPKNIDLSGFCDNIFGDG